MKPSPLKKIYDQGLWVGPRDNLLEKMKHAYQMKKGNAFIGVFDKGILSKYPEFDSGHNTMYLGNPSEWFHPRKGRDKVRGSDGELVLFEKESIEIITVSLPFLSEESFGGSSLVYDRQMNIVVPSVFDEYDIKVFGAGGLGTETSIQLTKMGADRLSMYDPSKILMEDVAVSSFRVSDEMKYRVAVAGEIVAEQTKKVIGRHVRLPTKSDFGDIAINTFTDNDVRRKIWQLAKKSSNLYIDAQVRGESGVLFVIDPEDRDSVALYEEDLSSSCCVKDSIIYVVKLMASLVSGAVKRYVSTPGNEKNSILDRMYFINMDTFFSEAGCWGQLRKH